MKKKSAIFTMLIILIFSAWSQVFALSNISGVDPKANLDEAKPIAANIIGTMQWIGYAIAVIMLVIIGIKYITSSADDKASLKSAAWKYVLGALLITGAVTFVDWIFN